ncbi:MAG: metal-dependent hydrolase [Terrimicrobiaceae bacterium]|nr:metal-dependent hydrolase [Terrimicrobiaceae bacterium]
MDSLTQAVLGAAVAEAGLGRKLGNRALAWGAALGTLPDLDILVYPWLDTVQQLEWHRGISHSVFLATLAAPLFGWLIHRIHWREVGVVPAAWTVWWVLVTHSLIDVFTVYGTMVFTPFSDARIGTNNLFIIDPLFTLPLIVGLLAACLLPRSDRRRFSWNTAGLVLASVYVAWSFGAKAIADWRLDAAFRENGVNVQRMISMPTPFNTLLWRGVAEDKNGFWITYHSLLRPDREPDLLFVSKNHELAGNRLEARAFERLAWFSNGWFSVETGESGWIVRDWRFAEFPGPDGRARALFSWEVAPDGSAATPARSGVPPGTLRRVWDLLTAD